MMILTSILAVILLYADYHCVYSSKNKVSGYAGVQDNMVVPWNGYGCIGAVLNGTAFRPMQYRVLVPWLYAIIPLPPSKSLYLGLKGVAIWFALFSFSLYCQAIGVDPVLGTVLLAAVLPMTFKYDYIDCYFELGFLSLAYVLTIQGAFIWLIPITILATLNRETGVLIPLIYLSLTSGLVGTLILFIIFGVALSLPRIIYGNAELPHDFIMLKRNIRELSVSFETFFLLVITSLLIGAGFTSFLPPLFYWLMVCFFVAISIPALWREVRVYMPLYLIIIPAVVTWI